ncbi:MAG: hypothetical protein ACRC6R_10095 [Bacteroidales bacterium]
MARIPETNISRNAVRAILQTTKRNLYNLCRSHNINILAKYSPLVAGGSRFIYNTSSSPVATLLYESFVYERSYPEDSRLSYFANYDSAQISPVSLMWPEKLLKANNNGFQPIFMQELPYSVTLHDIYQLDYSSPLYMCTVFQNVSSGQFLYTTEWGDCNLANVAWPVGSKVKVGYCVTDTQHRLSDVATSARFYGCRVFDQIECERVYTLESPGGGVEGIEGIILSDDSMYYNNGSYAQIVNSSGRLYFTVKGTSVLSVDKRVTVAIVEDNAAYNRTQIGYIDCVAGAESSKSFTVGSINAKDGMMLRQLYLEYTSGSESLLVMMRQGMGPQ